MPHLHAAHQAHATLHCLVTSIGSFSAGAVIASLRKFPGTTISGTNSCPAEWIFHASLVDQFHQVPHATHSTELICKILNICHQEKITHILPLTDIEIDLFSEQRQAFDDLGVTLCIPSTSAISICRDKWLVYQQFLPSSLVKVIPTFRIDEDIEHLTPFPLLAKPRKGRSSEGLVRLSDTADLQHLRTRTSAKACIIQPLLSGPVHVVDIVRQQSNQKWAATSRIELMRTPNGAGTAVQMTANAQLIGIARTIAQDLEINGCINIEFIQQGDDFYLMDINPRFSAGIAFSKLHGYDMVRNHLLCHMKNGDDIEPPNTHNRSEIINRHYVESISDTGNTHATEESR